MTTFRIMRLFRTQSCNNSFQNHTIKMLPRTITYIDKCIEKSEDKESELIEQIKTTSPYWRTENITR